MVNKLQKTLNDYDNKKDTLTKLLETIVEELDLKLGAALEQYVLGETDVDVDRTDLAIACTFLVDYNGINNPALQSLATTLISLLEYMANLNFSSEVGRSIIKMSTLYNATLTSYVDEDKTTTNEQLDMIKKQAGL